MKISRQYADTKYWCLTAALEHVLSSFGFTLDDCGLVFRDDLSPTFTLTTPKRVNVSRLLGLLSDYIFIGPVARDLF